MPRKYAIVGLGLRTGIGLLQHLKNFDVDVFDAGDLQAVESLARQYKSVGQKVTVYKDEAMYLKKNTAMVLVSPGVPAKHPIIEQAKLWQIPVQTEIDFSFAQLHCPVVGITGSLGKSTMAKMSFDLLSNRYKNVFLGGNYGTALIQAVDKDCDMAVVEVSSFQLEQSELFHPTVSIFLNVYENHLDRHRDIDAYLDAKQRIFQNQDEKDYAIVSVDQGELVPEQCRAKTYTFSICGNQRADAYIRDGEVFLLGQPLAMDLAGHPSQQILALLLLAHIYNIEISTVAKVLIDFKPLEHRQEKIEKADIVFINDSKSTTPDATLFAISQYEDPVHLIMCGKNKNMQLDGFAEKLSRAKNIVTVTVFGQMGAALRQVIMHPNLVEVSNLDQALEQVMKVVKSGDVVLFSPGFTSFDQYQNVEQRGQHFKQLVADIKL